MHGLSERPRELRWYHAAGMLFGDWGTSRLYVLGAAFVMSGHASFWYVAVMCALVSLVGFAYTIICAHFPDGGGVYSAAKQRSRTLAVVGALLLIADYIITAALSAYVGFRYMLPDYVDKRYALYAAVLSILAIGGLNIFGPRRVGAVAVVVALLSGVFYLLIAGFCLPHLGATHIHLPTEHVGAQWSHFVNVILALSGVEAIANMTGVMAEPVAKNARKAIWIVLLEVVVLNLIMAYAVNGLPALKNIDLSTRETVVAGQKVESGTLVNIETGAPVSDEQRADYSDHMVKILATHYVSPWFATVASIFFGLLLLSAANTAIGDMVSIQYLMSRDKELPSTFTRLNRFGMPWVGLLTATVVPAVVLLIIQDNTSMLEALYAIGVVGAISINLMACGTNKELRLKRWETATLLGVGALVILIELTICYEKPAAVLFAGVVLGAGLLARYAVKRLPAPVIVPERELRALADSGERAVVSASMPRLLIPTRGHPKMLKFAVQYAKDKGAAVFVLFVREVALTFRERGTALGSETMTLANDKEAQRVFSVAKELCDKAGVPMVKLYAVHDSPAELILDHAATLGVDAVLMGVSQRGALWKTLRGDVLQEVINYLPQSIPLLIHA
jgi:amino acid transporter/nucleotide-binding universal stress UspA family protein